jgi:hypothetical protein
LKRLLSCREALRGVAQTWRRRIRGGQGSQAALTGDCCKAFGPAALCGKQPMPHATVLRSLNAKPHQRLRPA